MTIFDGVLSVTLVGFNGWNWYLAVKGWTSVDFMSSFKSLPATVAEQHDFKSHSYRGNLYAIFGTTKLLRMLSPSMRNVPFTGLEWAFLMKDQGFTQQGYKLVINVNDTEAGVEMTRSSNATMEEKSKAQHYV